MDSAALGGCSSGGGIDGSGYILDIAGGRGALATSLIKDHGRRCVVVDPAGLALKRRQRQVLQRAGIVLDGGEPSTSAADGDTNDGSWLRQRAEWFDEAFVQRNQALVGGADALVGLHPDQATEAIVDAALLLGLPFAVVPCCVFPQLGLGRRLAGGQAVMTTADFVEYLAGKDGGIQVATLGFAGANVTVYSRARR